MKSQARLAAYIGVAAALLLIFVLAPGAWAEPLQNRHGQTVPTPTPLGGPPTATPTATTRPPEQPPDEEPSAPSGPAAPSGAQAPAGGASTAVPLKAASPLALTNIASRSEVWPGAVVEFTLTLANQSNASVRDVVITVALPPSLEPGAAQGAGASWQGSTLTARRPVLPPGGSMAVTFTARVSQDALPGAVIVSSASAAAAGVPAVTAAATLVTPPLELPPTGGESPNGH
jgi:uncharacterized repeat protein (TIGR01451 family)